MMSVSQENIVSILRAAGEPTRLRILALLEHGDLAVGELVQILGQSQPRLSHHLKTLTSAGVVERMPEGSWVFYRLVQEGAAARILSALLQELEKDQGDFSRDARQLNAIRSARVASANEYFERVADTWDTVRSLHYPNEAIERALLDVAGSGPFEQVVDIGTGTGRMLTLFAPLATKADGIDLSHKMLTVARANLTKAGADNARVRQGDATAVPFEDASADLVILHQVLHFIDTPEQVISETARILRPGGRLLVVDFAPHELEFLRTDHAHRHLGVHHDMLGAWTLAHGLALSKPRRFDPPEDLKEGLAVQIWSADKFPLKKEAAA